MNKFNNKKININKTYLSFSKKEREAFVIVFNALILNKKVPIKIVEECVEIKNRMPIKKKFCFEYMILQGNYYNSIMKSCRKSYVAALKSFKLG